jgi:DNA-directed RNA polymerase subunit RPC12/RpoP
MLYELIARVLPMAAYVCRGCGTEIPYPHRYTKCPEGGIKW